MIRVCIAFGLLTFGLLAGSPSFAQKPPAKPQAATAAETLKVPKGFHVELLYSVPKPSEGSWVNLCVDPKGRLIVSDQYGSLYRVTPPAIGMKGESKIEKIPAEIGMAQGLLWAFNSLYVVVNDPKKAGLYRVTDSNDDDMLDKVETLRTFESSSGGIGEHGPHAILLTPDKKRLTIVCGNQTKLTKVDSSRVPMHFGEDHLLQRIPDGNGFMKGVLAPGGCIYTLDPEGKNWELVSSGFRNQFDAAYNRDGELFTYDADMEWDANTPWYRPTRICHVTSGSEFGWRNGAGKYPAHFPDNLPGICDIGPGSPTGVCFGYGAKFPAKYQDALFACDWSYGKLYAVHLTPKGSSFLGVAEEFISGTPLPLTDVIISPVDGAMYFTIGGRKTQSGLYRVTYTGKESIDPPAMRTVPDSPEVSARKQLEAFHGKQNPEAVRATWPHLSSADRFVRFAARIALEHQPIDTWQEKALTEKEPQTAVTALLALARSAAPDPLHANANGSKVDPALGGKIVDAILKQDFAKLPGSQQIEVARLYEIVFNRYGTIDPTKTAKVQASLNAAYPTSNRFVDGEVCEVLVFLNNTEVVPKTMKLLAEAPTQEEQLQYVRALRMANAGWTLELRKQYFRWFMKAATYKGGNSFRGFLKLIEDHAKALLSDAERKQLQPIWTAQFVAPSDFAPPRPFVKKWTLDDLAPVLEKGLKAGGRDYERGRKLFGAANCFACHRYDNEGGSAGPDLSGVAGRFAIRDLLESILDPNKEISDQYAAVEVDTLDGKKLVGRIVNLKEDTIMLNTDMLNPNGIVQVNRNNIDVMKSSKLSMMPAGLLDTLKDDEVLDLMAYLLSRGDRTSPMFKK